MRTRRSKLVDDAEPEETTESKENEGKTTSVDVILEESPETCAASAVPTKQDESDADQMTEGVLSSDKVEERILDSVNMKESVLNSDRVEGSISDSDKMEEGVLNTDRVKGDVSDLYKMIEDALDSDKTDEGVLNADSVEGGVSESGKLEESVLNSDRGEGGVSNVDKMIEDVLDSEKTDEGVLNSDEVEQVAPSQTVKDASDEEMAVMDYPLTLETASKTAVEGVEESVNNSNQSGGSSSSVTVQAESKISNTVKTPDEPVGGDGHSEITTVDEPISWKIEKDIIEIIHKNQGDRTPTEKLALRNDLHAKTKQAKIFGKKICEERNITFPNHRAFHGIVYRLYMYEKLDEKNLEKALESAAQNKQQPLSDVVVLDSKEEGVLSTLLTSDSLTVTPDQMKEPCSLKLIREKYREYAKKYCDSKDIPVPGRRRFFRMMQALSEKQEFNEEKFKILLDQHGKNMETQMSALKPDNEKHELLPSVVKPMDEMTEDERAEFFKQFSTLRKELKPIAIKHCHAIKAPFPKSNVYYSICRDLFEAGMLDEENVKIGVEMAFEEFMNMKGPLSDEELSVIVKHYVGDKGIKDISPKRMKKEFLHQIPKRLLTRKHYCSLMYKERKTNLFLDKALALPSKSGKNVSSKNPELSTEASAVENISATSSGVPAKLKSNQTSSEPQTVEEPKIPRKRLRESKSARWSGKTIKKLHDMGLPWSDYRSQLKGNTRDMLAQKSSQSSSRGSTQSKLALDSRSRFAEKPSQSSSRTPTSVINSQKVPALMGIKLRKLPTLMEQRSGAIGNANAGIRFAEETSNARNVRATGSDKTQSRSILNLPSTSSGGTRHYTNTPDISARYPSLKKYSQAGDEEPLEQLLIQTEKLISKNEQLIGGLQYPGSSQSRSWQRENAEKPVLSCRQRTKLKRKSSHLQGEQYSYQHKRGAHLDAGQSTVPSQLIPEYNYPAQNVLIANFTSHTNYGEHGSHLESRGRSRAETSRNDYSRSSGRRSQGCDYEDDLVEGSSGQRWSERDPVEGSSGQRWSERDPMEGSSGQRFLESIPMEGSSGQRWSVRDPMEGSNGQRWSEHDPVEGSSGQRWLQHDPMEGSGGQRWSERDPMEGSIGQRWLKSNTVEGSSGQRWLERGRFSPPRSNEDDLRDYLEHRKNNERYDKKLDAPFPPPPPPIISSITAVSTSRKHHEQSARKQDKDGDWKTARREVPQKKSLYDHGDWRLARIKVPRENSRYDEDKVARHEPPQKKSRSEEDRGLQPAQSVYLQSEMNDFDSWMSGNTRRAAEPLNQETSSRRSWRRESPPEDVPKTSQVKEAPPIYRRGNVCKVGIVHEDYPGRGLTSEEAGLIRAALLERIGLQSGVGPRFTDTYVEKGAVVFECEDQLTVSWLWLNASTIIPWRSARLRPTSMEKPPKEIAIQIPKMLQSLTPRALCDRLMSQNPGLTTKDWDLKSSDLTSWRDAELCFCIDDGSLDALKSLDLKPYLGFSRVSVRIIRE